MSFSFYVIKGECVNLKHFNTLKYYVLTIPILNNYWSRSDSESPT